jgi:hypothetical protein
MEGFHFFLIQHKVFILRSFQLITIYYIKFKLKKNINQIVTKSINIHSSRFRKNNIYLNDQISEPNIIMFIRLD